MTERFSRDQFENALPRCKVFGDPLWRFVGFVDGECVYTVKIIDNPGVLIYIRSSIRADGLAADSAQDSIRCWLASDNRGTPLGSKDSRWITRVNGWQMRMTETLRKLWRLGHQLERCPKCQSQLMALKVKKLGPNKGRWFSACPSCANGFQKWLQDDTPKKK
jgi:hypothetical protein